MVAGGGRRLLSTDEAELLIFSPAGALGGGQLLPTEEAELLIPPTPAAQPLLGWAGGGTGPVGLGKAVAWAACLLVRLCTCYSHLSDIFMGILLLYI